MILLLSAVSASAILESLSLSRCLTLLLDSSRAGGDGGSFHFDTAENDTTISVGFKLSTTKVRVKVYVQLDSPFFT